MPRFVPLPPLRNDVDLLAQIEVLERRRARLRAEMLVVIVGALALAIALGFYLLLP
ncbi:MAG: hypothetical protein JXA21_16765 [Anaerolineae bacterium]|nr:hypothetical protein [Anaerolineae bacterium]